MKGFTKYLITGTIIIVIGIVVLLIGAGMGGCNMNPEFLEVNYTQHSESIQNVCLDFSVGEIETVLYDGDKIEIDYHTSNVYNVEISEKNGTLTYKLRSKWWVSWGLNVNHPKTVIRLPENSTYNMKLDLSAGLATINGGHFGNLSIDMSAGKINLNGTVKCKELDIDVSAGKVDVNIVECSSLNVELSAGQVDIDRATCPQIDIELSAGSVSLGVNGLKSAYTIKVDKSAGSCNVQNQTGTNTSKKIDVELSAGSVNISFTN